MLADPALAGGGDSIINKFKTLLPDLSHFVLPLCQPPISILYSAAFFHLSIFYPLPKWFPISIHILIHLPPNLFIYFLFDPIHSPFNLSLLFSVCLHTSSAFSLLYAITSFQAGSFILTAAFISLFHHHTLLVFSPNSRWATHFSCTFHHCPFYLLPHMLDIIFFITFYSYFKYTCHILLSTDVNSVSDL